MNLASKYVAHGMALVPIPIGQKGPVSTGWNKPENVITDPEQAAALAGNIGIAHAYCLPVPTMALDIDDLVLAKRWLAERGVNLDALLDADDAAQILSGKAGRAKLLYRLPPGLAPIESLTIKGGGLFDG